MEDFDRHIQSEIGSLTEVPGVAFNEKRVWRRVLRSWNGNLKFFIVAIFLLAVWAFVFFLPDEDLQENTTSYLPSVSAPEVLVDSTLVVFSEDINPATNSKIVEINRDTASGENIAKESKSGESSGAAREIEEELDQSSSSSEKIRKISPLLIRPTSVDPNFRKELSIVFGRGSQTVGITHLRKLNNHLSLSAGIQFDMSGTDKLNRSDRLYTGPRLQQIQIPVGLRYNLRKREGLFNPFLYSGLQNSVLINPDPKIMDYHLRFESELGLDFRILSTRDGKKGYLRFKLPLYNRSIISQGIHQPNLYDALK